MKADAKKNGKKVEKDIEKLLSKMTLDEKISMLHGTSLFQSGGVERLGIPGVMTSDECDGRKSRIHARQMDSGGKQ